MVWWKAGFETLLRGATGEETQLPVDDAALHLIQQIRDEAHRFAITGHRQRRATARTTSSLEQIEGVGEKRRRSLLRYFGGMQEIKRAAQEDLAKVPGISPRLAEKIFNQFHNS